MPVIAVTHTTYTTKRDTIQVLRENTTMLAMCREFGFQILPDPDDAEIRIVRLVM
jgi:hypothetical protein